MVKHVVMWSFKPEVDKEVAFRKMKEIFSTMEGKIPGMQKLELIKGYQGYDACLITEHASRADIDVYQEHPLHQPVKHYMHSIIAGRASCDGEG